MHITVKVLTLSNRIFCPIHCTALAKAVWLPRSASISNESTWQYMENKFLNLKSEPFSRISQAKMVGLPELTHTPQVSLLHCNSKASIHQEEMHIAYSPQKHDRTCLSPAKDRIYCPSFKLSHKLDRFLILIILNISLQCILNHSSSKTLTYAQDCALI